DRLYTKEFVIGLKEDGLARAYPFSVLNYDPIINDTFGDNPILVTFDLESAAGVVFKRTVDGQTLTFDLKEDAPDGPLLMVDQETGSVWQALTGEAIEGPLEGKALEQIPTTHAFWFGWKDFYPDTEVYGQ
ncbi:MAG: DUF3179 domain-containing (seleno)protein, partial [Dehalococcoidia bacterium]